MAIVNKKEEVEEKIQDLDLSVTKKTKFRINGDNNYIIELDTSDLSITTRISEAYPKLLSYVKDAEKQINAIGDDDDVDSLTQFTTALKDIDDKMRGLIDYIFDSDVSSKVAPTGTMYDPYEGDFRFEIILTKLIGLYSNNLNEQFAKMKKKVSKHTDKYTKKYHK